MTIFQVEFRMVSSLFVDAVFVGVYENQKMSPLMMNYSDGSAYLESHIRDFTIL